LITVTLTITALVMQSLYRGERRIYDDLDGQRMLNQLSHQLRSDAHEASKAVVEKIADSNAPRKLILALADSRSIHYSVLPNRIERIAYRRTDIEHREVFRMVCPDSYWSIDEDGELPLLTLHLLRRDAEPTSAFSNQARLVIEAVVGISAAPVGS
jgi:hypothetical protein